MSHIRLTEECLHLARSKVFRIEALVDLPLRGVKRGDRGGFVENALQVSGAAWVSGNARVYENAMVSGNSVVTGNACVYGDAQISDNAVVCDNSRVHENAWVSGNARISGDAQISGNARFYGDAWIYGNASVSGDAHVDCSAAILILGVMAWSTVTITRESIFIGRVQIDIEKWNKITQKQAIGIGCPKELYKPLRAMVLAGAQIVRGGP